MTKVTKLRQREWFVYDKKAQETMSPFAKFLVEYAVEHSGEYGEYSPACHCLIVANSSVCHSGADVMFEFSDVDPGALRYLIGALEEVKHRAMVRLMELGDIDDE